MYVLAIDAGDTALQTYRDQLRPWCPANGWVYQEFHHPNDLLEHLENLLATDPDDCLEGLELIAHGGPNLCDGFEQDNATDLGPRFGQLRLCRDFYLILSGCNTALGEESPPFPQLLANTMDCAVYGTVGYITGTWAEGNAVCTRETEYRGRRYPAYPNSQNATGVDCFRLFRRVAP
jgi:hypothetical protein